MQPTPPPVLTAVEATTTTDLSALGSHAFTALAEADVPADQLFFHKFFSLRSARSRQLQQAKAKAAKRSAAAASGLDEMTGLDSDSGDEADEEESEELGAAPGGSDEEFDEVRG
jgi:hypothetical protein